MPLKSQLDGIAYGLDNLRFHQFDGIAYGVAGGSTNTSANLLDVSFTFIITINIVFKETLKI